MPGARLVRLLPPLTDGEWSLDPAQLPRSIGRSRGDAEGPDVDLWPDLGVSQRHARMWHADGAQWLEDVGSRGGTRLDGVQVDPGCPVRVAPGSIIEMGHSRLVFVAPTCQVLRHRGWCVEIDLPAPLSYVLTRHEGTARWRVVLHNCAAGVLGPGRLDLALEAYANATVAVPVVAAGSCHVAARMDWSFELSAMEALRERRWVALVAQIDGETIASHSLGVWLLPPTEFSFAPEHRLSLAAFVLPSHPLTARLAADGLASEPAGVDPSSLLRALYEHLHSTWHINYRHEPPRYAAEAQRIRLPHDVLADPIVRTGQGTCLDLALLVAGLLEAQGAQPLIAVLDLSTTYHALVGCWRQAGPRLDPVIDDSQRLLADAVWADPNGCTRDDTQRSDFETASAKAVDLLLRFPLLFAIDVAAARSDGIEPLPFSGEPPWDRIACEVLAHAARFAEVRGHSRSTVAVLVGLLRARGGVFRDAFARHLGDPDAIADRLVAATPPSSGAAGGSRNYRAIVTNATIIARVEQAAFVSELHLLASFLDIRSSALDGALLSLGTTRAALRAAVLRIAPNLPAPPGDSTIPSLPRSSP